MHKITRAQRSPELALRSTDFRAPKNLIYPALVDATVVDDVKLLKDAENSNI